MNAPQVATGWLLSEAQFNDMSSRPYDPFWLDRLGLSPYDKMNLLNGFNSKLKIEDLIRGEVFMAGDVLQAELKVRVMAGSNETRTVTMTAEVGRPISYLRIKHTSLIPTQFFNTGPYGQPILRVQAPRQPSGYRDIKCTGLGKIIQAWMEEDPLLIVAGPPSGYKSFRVSRNGTELGSLWDMRQIWHLWRQEKDAWAAHRGQICRRRRVTKSEKDNGYRYVRGRLTRTTTDGGGIVLEPPAGAYQSF